MVIIVLSVTGLRLDLGQESLPLIGGRRKSGRSSTLAAFRFESDALFRLAVWNEEPPQVFSIQADREAVNRWTSPAF